MCLAVEDGHKDLVIDLVGLGADVNLPSNNIESAMGIAAGKGDTDMVMLLLSVGASVNPLKRMEGMEHYPVSPMHCACGGGHLHMVKLLHNLGADLNDTESTCGYSAMMMAAENGHKDVVLYLINHGADYNQQKHDSMNAMEMALGEKHSDTYFAMLAAIEIREIREMVKRLTVI